LVLIGTNAPERYFDVKWFKRYAVSCLIAMFVFAAVDAHARPGQNPREGAIIVTALGWPIVMAIAMGGAVGEVLGKHQGK
jgi:hypothetical protein